ncbi:uncharacterized protein LOC141858717 [Brevipalpus obovatus]|uniref:uncharacterized protein LOC141858717 n=1 Tax=Brevipalpus obovatus TaxID=246614 RepID=UPI003D9F1343
MDQLKRILPVILMVLALNCVHILSALPTTPTSIVKANGSSKNNSDPVFQVKTITRDEWLAKEYFGYLCAPNECVNQSNKTQIRQRCFGKHSKLNQVLKACYKSDHQCNETNDEKTLDCVMEASRNDATLIPMELHICVDDLITMQTWKCIRRFHLSRFSQILERMKKQSKSKGLLSLNITALMDDGSDLVKT